MCLVRSPHTRSVINSCVTFACLTTQCVHTSSHYHCLHIHINVIMPFYSMSHNLSDGQYMASRISRGIQQETQKLKTLLHKYNLLVSDHLSWKDVTDLSSSIWNPTDDNNITLPSLGQLKRKN